MADPYSVLGVSGSASDEEVRAAYRRLVKLHHPDHNGGSAEAARRFEAVQAAYGEVQRLRRAGSSGGPRPSTPGPRPSTSRPSGPGPRPSTPRPRPDGGEPEVDARLADLERQVREASAARERAARAARQAAAAAEADARRPTDEELGYIRTDDSFWKILSDARDELSERFEQAKDSDHPVARRVSDLIDGLEELSEKLDRPPRKQS